MAIGTLISAECTDYQIIRPSSAFVTSGKKILSQMTNFNTSKLNEFTDDNFEYVKTGRKFSKRVENTVGKGEKAH